MKNHEKEIKGPIIDEEEVKEENKKTLVAKFKEKLAEEEGLGYYLAGIAVGGIAGATLMKHKIMTHKTSVVDYDKGRDVKVTTKQILNFCKRAHDRDREIWYLDKQIADLVKKVDDPNWEIILKPTKNED